MKLKFCLVFRDIGDELGEAEALSGLGEVYQSMGEPANALSFHQVRIYFIYTDSVRLFLRAGRL